MLTMHLPSVLSSAPQTARILGIDPGTLRTGYAVLQEEAGEVSVLAVGVLAPAARLPLGGRLHEIYMGLLELIGRWVPTEVAVEEPFVAKNARTAMAVGQAQGTALMAAAARGIDSVRYPPRQVKSAVTGYGGSGKEQVQLALQVQLDINGSTIQEDAADALAVALCHVRTRDRERVLAQG